MTTTGAGPPPVCAKDRNRGSADMFSRDRQAGVEREKMLQTERDRDDGERSDRPIEFAQLAHRACALRSECAGLARSELEEEAAA